MKAGQLREKFEMENKMKMEQEGAPQSERHYSISTINKLHDAMQAETREAALSIATGINVYDVCTIVGPIKAPNESPTNSVYLDCKPELQVDLAIAIYRTLTPDSTEYSWGLLLQHERDYWIEKAKCVFAVDVSHPSEHRYTYPDLFCFGVAMQAMRDGFCCQRAGWTDDGKSHVSFWHGTLRARSSIGHVWTSYGPNADDIAAKDWRIATHEDGQPVMNAIAKSPAKT